MLTPEQKYDKLKKNLAGLGGALVAFSGGVDSALLLYAAREALGNGVLAVTIKGDIHAPGTDIEVTNLAKTLGVRHEIVHVDFLQNDNFCQNVAERCYLCKKEMFLWMKQIAHDNELPAIIEGSNASDKKDLRPGSQAAVEFGVQSPLEEAGLVKGEIRLLARKFNIPVWNKPSDTCLCTRIPPGEKIDAEKIARVNAAEKVLAKMGYGTVRVRSYGLKACIEVEKNQVQRLVSGTSRDIIVERFKKLGYQQICIDLEGYRSGGQSSS